MPWIKSENPAHTHSGEGRVPSIKTPEMGKRIEFNKQGSAQVSDELAEYLSLQFDCINIMDEESDE